MTEKFTFFWSGPFSQWYSSTFELDGITFNCAEQYMMYKKAVLFDDLEVANKIMKVKNPNDQKALGRVVTPFDKVAWDNVARTFVETGSIAKFSQNPDLLKKLAATVGTTLVEASPHDKIWGIGLKESDPRALKRETWLGTNWLGEVLTKVRDGLL